MPDFLDRFGAQLTAASVTPAVSRKGLRVRGLRSRTWRRGVLVSLALLAVAAPAVAVVKSWSPTLGRTANDSPATSDSTPVIASARDALAVLRRPQTDEDRAIAEPLLKAIGGPLDKVQTASVRALADGWVLVPVMSLESAPGQTKRDELCITNGGGIGCMPASTVGRTGITLQAATPTQTSWTGLVPDGVARVRLTTSRGIVREVEVVSNLFSLSVPETRPAPPVTTPEGYDGPATIPGPPIPIDGRIEWLDGQGRITAASRVGLGLDQGATAP